MTKTEIWLAKKAECGSDFEAKWAMKALRKFYGKTYGWCADCDYLVTKEEDCCLNRVPSHLELYNYLKEEWKTDDKLIPFKFPVASVTANDFPKMWGFGFTQDEKTGEIDTYRFGEWPEEEKDKNYE